MNLELNEKIIIVSGDAQRFSAELVNELVAENAVPVIIGRSQADNLKALESIQQKVFQVSSDFASAEDYGRALQQVVEKFGRIDGLINNAEVKDGVDLENGNYADFVTSLRKNLLHDYLVTHHALPYLKESKGVIVNVTSKTSETQDRNNSANSWSNDGRNALTREWAVELLPYGIRVNSIIVDELFTSRKELISNLDNSKEKLKSISNKIASGKKITRVEEIARMVVFLLSARSSHTTGQLIYVRQIADLGRHIS